MVQVERTLTVRTPVERVAEYLADFAHTKESVPGTVGCTRTGETRSWSARGGTTCRVPRPATELDCSCGPAGPRPRVTSRADETATTDERRPAARRA